ncbi:MAG: hypothetical protein AAGH15_13975 [Myxococcota bacterium]
MRSAAALLLALVAALASFAEAQSNAAVSAAEPAPPSAAVLVAGAPEADLFRRAYAFEVTASAMSELGFRVAPLQLTTSAMGRGGADAETCVADRACLRRVAAELGAPTLVVAHAAKRRDRWRLRLQLWQVRAEAEPGAQAEIIGNANELLGSTLPLLRARVPEEAPCVVQLAGPPGMLLRVDGEERLAEAGRVFVGPGRHALELVAAQRAPWRGTLRCVGGRTFRVEAR